ncbi:hypothetical protein CAPTEDRAFT_214034 [Capitella teleta]|uniref:THAP-type domain-containing protein n=1 Tax=Capitella teleta TaxID=283909 RepID=R7TRD8_CAPTE|nr:hypothetical protein CAPTEDRAFT_214034 [Capitella teleta]|eukprot:ELT94061.1 hypothetical protein CAPTEDRAFT_214034 [Capitella teleta]
MGENCGMHGCSLNRRRATKVISFHDILRIKDQDWRSSLVASLGREFTKEKLKMKSRKHLYICSRHFEEKCIVQGKKCHLVHGSMPTKFLPVSSHSNAVKPRKEPSFREPPVVPGRIIEEVKNEKKKK